MEKPLEKPFVREAPEAVPSRDVRVVASPTRCPYCHADVAPESSDWVACKACLARHHEACWRENGACGTCAQAVCLDTRKPRVARRMPVFIAIAVAFVVAGLLVARAVARSQQELDARRARELAFGPSDAAQRAILERRAELTARIAADWESLRVGDTFELEIEHEILDRDGRVVSTTRATQTVIARTENSVTVRLASDAGTSVVEMSRFGREYDRYPHEWLYDKDAPPETLETKAGTFACRHYRTNPDMSVGAKLSGPNDAVVIERWFAGNVVVPLRTVRTESGVGTMTDTVVSVVKARQER